MQCSSLQCTFHAEAARRFVLGKTFAYSCFDGTRGSGRIFNDGSAVGTIQSSGGPTRMAALPPGSLRVKGDMVCATMRGMPIDPCFNLTKTDANSFRGAISVGIVRKRRQRRRAFGADRGDLVARGVGVGDDVPGGIRVLQPVAVRIVGVTVRLRADGGQVLNLRQQLAGVVVRVSQLRNAVGRRQ